jgi:hypothetical protein
VVSASLNHRKIHRFKKLVSRCLSGAEDYGGFDFAQPPIEVVRCLSGVEGSVNNIASPAAERSFHFQNIFPVINEMQIRGLSGAEGHGSFLSLSK